MNEKQSFGWGEFIARMGIWGFIGFMNGVRGFDLLKPAFWGPLSEQIFDYRIEEIPALLEQELQRKQQEAALTNLINELGKINLLPTKIDDPELLSPKLIDNPIQPVPLNKWHKVLKHPAIAVILGGRGSGKTATGYCLLEDFKNSLSPYVVGLPKKSSRLLPNCIGIEERLEDVPPKSITLLDEAYLQYHSRKWREPGNKDISRILNLSRQQEKTIVFVAQIGRQVDIDIVSSADVLIIKNPGMLQTQFDRPELRSLLLEAEQAFQSVTGDVRRWSYVCSQSTNFTGLIENDLPSFWSPKLSNTYADAGESATPKLPKKMTNEEKIQMTKDLYFNKGWSLDKLAQHFGVVKGTIFNWVKDYPYKKES